MLPCPNCNSEDRVVYAGKGPEFIEVRARDAAGNPTEIYRHPRWLVECLTCNLALVEDRSVSKLVQATDSKGQKIATRKDSKDKNDKIVADDRKRMAEAKPKIMLGPSPLK